jgi:hypothetical protein
MVLYQDWVPNSAKSRDGSQGAVRLGVVCTVLLSTGMIPVLPVFSADEAPCEGLADDVDEVLSGT